MVSKALGLIIDSVFKSVEELLGVVACIHQLHLPRSSLARSYSVAHFNFVLLSVTILFLNEGSETAVRF